MEEETIVLNDIFAENSSFFYKFFYNTNSTKRNSLRIASSEILEKKISRYSDSQMSEMISNLFAIQLTQGFSNMNAYSRNPREIGIKSYISPGILESLLKKYPKQFFQGKDKIFLQHNSEPYDYDFEGYDIVDLQNLFSLYDTNSSKREFIDITTSVPRGKEEEVFSILIDDYYVSKENKLINSVIVDDFNYRRLRNEYEKFSKKTEFFIENCQDFPSFLKSLNNSSNGKVVINRAQKYSQELEGLTNSTYSTASQTTGVLLTPTGFYNVKQLRSGYPKKTQVLPNRFRVEEIRN